jgi:hypothetical protein
MPPPPSQAPELPPRPDSATGSRTSALEVRIYSLESSLTQKTASEQRLREENGRLKDAIRQFKDEKEASESEHNEKLALLTEEVERMRRLAAQLRGKISSQALKTEVPKTPPRAALMPSKAQPQDKSPLHLSALVEVYKKMPDFTRPTLQIDFSAYMPTD